MNSPITGKKMNLVREPDTLTFRKENFPIVYHYYLCGDSGERFTDEPFGYAPFKTGTQSIL